MFKHFLGIDISKDSFDISLLNESGEVSLSKKLSMDKTGFDKLLAYLKDYDKDEILIAMEATGIYHLSLLSNLLDNGFKCAVINPMLIKNFIASSTLRKTKNDKKDSSSIALFALKSQNLLRLSNANSISCISVLIKEREKLAKQVALLKTEIKANLVQLFPEMLKNINIFTKSILNLLLKAPSANAIRRFKQKNIDKILFDLKGGSPIKLTSSDILALANSSIGVYNPYLEKVLTSKIRRLLNTYDEIDILDSEIENSLDDTDINDNIEILKSIPGIGDITSKNFATILNNINDFSSHKKLSAFIGIDPSIKQSGSSVFYQGKITKRGNSNLRRTIYQMAMGAIRHCDKFNAYFHKKIDEGKKYKQAVIAVANKLLKTIFSMLKNKTKFNNSNLVLGVSKVA